MSIVLALVSGFIVGVLINLLADYIPARRYYDIARQSPFTTVAPTPPHFLPQWPTAGQTAPLWLWSGVIAQLLNQRPFDPSRIGRRLLIEIGLALGWAWIVQTYGTHLALPFYLAYMPLLLLVGVIDLEGRLVPNEPLLVLAVLALLQGPLTGAPNLVNSRLEGALNTFVVVMAVYLAGFLFGFLMHLLTGRRIAGTILGFGDVKIATIGGALVGWVAMFPGLILIALLGGLGAIAVILQRVVRKKRYRRFTTFPYGPYIVAVIMLIIYQPDLLVRWIWWFLAR